MIYWNDDSLLLSVGLPLKIIGKLLTVCDSEEKLQLELEKIGKKYLERYLIMKDYRSLVRRGIQKLPIILLIAGFPGVGKTTLAKELSVALDIGVVIGGDAFRSVLRTFLPREKYKAFFISIYNSWQIFGGYTQENAILGFKSQSKVMNKAMQRLIVDRGFRDGESMIIEYLHFLPSQFDPELFEHPSLIPIVLRINDTMIYENRIKARDRFSHLRSPGDRLNAQKEKYLLLQDYQCNEASKFDLEIIDVDNLEEGFENALDYVIKRIKVLNEQKDHHQKLELIEDIKNERKIN